jgi:hypothetical protein
MAPTSANTQQTNLGDRQRAVVSPSPAYPVTRPAGHDDRLSISLVVDVAEVLHRHGFPAPARGRDLTELGDVLSTFIYGGAR